MPVVDADGHMLGVVRRRAVYDAVAERAESEHMKSQGIVGGEMAWPLVVVGIAMGLSLILVKVKSPMLFAVGMYLPLETTFAIFVGGLVRGFVEKQAAKRAYNDAQKARVENAGVLTASGLIAGEALLGLFAAAVVAFKAQRQSN